jgi:hypothetical protein
MTFPSWGARNERLFQSDHLLTGIPYQFPNEPDSNVNSSS